MSQGRKRRAFAVQRRKMKTQPEKQAEAKANAEFCAGFEPVQVRHPKAEEAQKPSRSDLAMQRQAAANGWITDAERLDRMAQVTEAIAADQSHTYSTRDRLAAQRAAVAAIRAKMAVAPEKPEHEDLDGVELSTMTDDQLQRLIAAG